MNLFSIIILNIINTLYFFYGNLYIFKSNFNCKLKRGYFLIVLLIFSTLIGVYFNNFPKLILTQILFIIIFKKCFSKGLKEISINNLFLFLQVMAIDTMLILILLIFKLDINMLAHNYIFLIISNIVIYSFAYISFRLKIFNKVYKAITDIYNANIFNIIFIFIFLSYSSYTFIYKTIDSKSLLYSKLIDISLILIYIFITIRLLYVKEKTVRLKQEFKSIEEYVLIYENTLEKLRINQHEYRNKLITIKSMINGKNKTVLNYINSITETEDVELLWIGELKYLSDNKIKGFLYHKTSEIYNKGIKVGINVSRNINNKIIEEFSIEDYRDLCIILGVLLDNAEEASICTMDSEVYIEIYSEKDNINIIISNTYNTNSEPKGYGRGYGLNLVNKVIKNNKKISLVTNKNKELYIQNIVIK